MHWDRKLGVIFAVVLAAAAMAVCGVVWWTTLGSQSSGDRIRGHAEVGFSELADRTADTENVGHVMISRRGKYSSQSRYEGFDETWLTALTMTGHEFLEEELKYTHLVKFRLRTYDTENVYLAEDTPEVYGRYTDEAAMFIHEGTCYVIYRSGSTEYRFIAECPPLTEWLKEIDG